MKTAYASLATALFLTGCWGAPPNEKLLTQACSTLFEGDPELVMEFTGENASITLDSFCSCYGASFANAPERTGLHKDILNALNVARKETGGDVDRAARKVADAISAGTIDTFTGAQLNDVGEYFEEVGESMNPNGQCPAA